MATGGELARSQVGASDAIYDFMCTPCAKNGKNTEAEHYCAECQTYFCKRCVDFHNTLLSSHTLLDKTAMKSKQSQTQGTKTSTTSPLPAITCEEHPGKQIEMFCGHHDVVCCTVCIAVNHRSCDGVEYIPTIAKGTAKGPERQKSKTTLEKVRHELQLLMWKRKNNLTMLHKQYDDCVKDIKDLKKRIIDTVNELERISIDEVKFRHRLTSERIHTDITSIDDMLKIVDTHLNKVNQVSNDEEASLFVHIKQSQTKTLQVEELVRTSKSKGDNSIEYELNSDIESALRDIKSLVSVEIVDTGSVTPYTASLLGTYDIRKDYDNAKLRSSVYGCCFIDGDQVVITDFNNNKLKRLNDIFKVSDSIDIKGNPYGVFNTGQYEVAVTLQTAKKVQFVSVRETLSLTHSFSVGDTCRGICCSKGHLYICCGSGLREGRVKVYDMSGSELYVIQSNQSGQNVFSLPQGITVTHDSSRLYVADGKKGIISVDIKGNQFDIIAYTFVKDAAGITVDDRGNIFACSFGSNNVVQIDRHGNVLRTLLSQTDGITKPNTLCYFKNPPRLLVCEEVSGLVKLYKLT